MLFIFSVISYIFGLLSYFLFLSDLFTLSVILSPLILIILLSCIKKFRTSVAFFLLCFYYSAILIAYFSQYTNKTILLQDDLSMIYLYGEIYKLEKSNYDNKNYIYLNNLVISKLYHNKTPSSVRLTYNGNYQFNIGDIIHTNASLYPPSSPLIPFGFNFQKNSFTKSIGASGFIIGNPDIIENINTSNNTFFNNILSSFKNNLKNGIKKHTTSDISPFLIALSLAEYQFLPKESLENLRKSALSHFISVSGYHISLISAFIFISLRFLLSTIPAISLRYDNKKIASIFTIIILLFYIFMIGNHTPAFRAIIMSIGFLLAIIFNFKAISLNSLFLAALLILIFAPYSIFSASFLLSFFATFNLIIFWNLKIIQKLFKLSKKNLLYKIFFYIIFSMLATLCVEITIAPILAFFFGSIPLMGILPNILVSPIFSFAVMLPIIIYFIFPIFIGKYFLLISEFGMKIILKIADYFANLSFSTLYTDFFSAELLLLTSISYLFFVIIKNKYSYIFLASFIATMAYYFLIKPYPDLLIDKNAKAIAIKINNQYVFSEKSDGFIKSVWIKNPKLLSPYSLNNNPGFICEDSHCVGKINNILISISDKISTYADDCGYVDIIILRNLNAPYKCKVGLTIDTAFLNKNGATTIHIKDNNLRINSANDNYLKFLLQ